MLVLLSEHISYATGAELLHHVFLISGDTGGRAGVVAAAYLMIFHQTLASVLCVLCVDLMVVTWTRQEGVEGK